MRLQFGNDVMPHGQGHGVVMQPLGRLGCFAPISRCRRHFPATTVTTGRSTQAQDQPTRNSDTAASRLLGTYQWLLVPNQADPAAPFSITATKAEGQTTSLAERASKKLGAEGQLTSQLGPATIRFALDNKVPAAWETGHIRVGELWQLFAHYPYMTRLRDRCVLDHGLTQPQSLVWQHDGFALADGYDDTTSRYRGLVLPTDTRPSPSRMTH